MTVDTERERWDARYNAVPCPSPDPCDALIRSTPWLPRTGRALDLACGLGANALWLAKQGFDVEAVDLSMAAVSALRAQPAPQSVNAVCADAAEYLNTAAALDVIVVSRFLDRDLCPAISRALAPGGVLIYQTFVGPHRGEGPRRAAFRLNAGELPTLFPDLKTLLSEEDPSTGPLRGFAALVARAAP